MASDDIPDGLAQILTGAKVTSMAAMRRERDAALAEVAALTARIAEERAIWDEMITTHVYEKRKLIESRDTAFVEAGVRLGMMNEADARNLPLIEERNRLHDRLAAVLPMVRALLAYHDAQPYATARLWEAVERAIAAFPPERHAELEVIDGE